MGAPELLMTILLLAPFAVAYQAFRVWDRRRWNPERDERTQLAPEDEENPW